MITTERIGVVGAAGSLGGKLGIQICSALEHVYGFDIAENTTSEPLTGVDPNLPTSIIKRRPYPVTKLEEILESCDVVHWAAPIDTVDSMPQLPSPTLLILHDSLMQNSMAAAERLSGRVEVVGQVAIAHCFMNQERKVAVATDLGETERLEQHIRSIGLEPELMSSHEHDTIKAPGQGAWAAICATLRPELEELKKRGLLSPSEERFLAAMEDNESHWTPASYRSIVSNPGIPDVLRRILEKHLELLNGG